MKANQSCYQIFIFPIRYKTVSFHHQAPYHIKFTPFQKSFTTCSIHPIRQLFTKQVQIKTDRNGNVWNVDGYITNLSQFKTNKFQIEYNDQLVKFKTGFITRIIPNQQLSVSIQVELIKHLKNQEKPLKQAIRKKVSSQTISINLKNSGNGFNIRRIIFATSQYISFLDLAYEFVKLSSPYENLSAQQNGVKQLKNIYVSEIQDRLKIYRELKIKTAQKISDFEEFKLNNFTFAEIAKFSKCFQEQFVCKDIPDLNYIASEFHADQQNFDSNVGINKFDEDENRHNKIVDVLSQHYQCKIAQLVTFIKIQGKMIERNIRALFQRFVQLTISLFIQQSLFIEDNEISRIKSFICESQKHGRKIQNNSSINSLDFSLQNINAHKQKMVSLNKQSSNIIGLQLKQPYVQILNYPQLSKTKRLDVDATLTVFIHGYKGNQYDLSKIKSHLSLLLGYNNFYSIKGLSSDKANSQTIYKLGQKAASQLMSYLSITPNYRHVNIIGFSLGGLIARAMLPWIEVHKDKLNLLVTIASPHLGLREIESCIVRAGLCYMRRLAGIQSIRELNSERNQSKSRYLIDLAEGKHLQWFKSIVLVGSFEDSYVPAYSSLVQYHGEDQITKEMSTRLQAKLKKAVRCVTQISYNETLIELITKRRSHINFLEQDSFIKYFITKFQDLFAYDS